MSQENVEIVRQAAAAFNRGDLDTWWEYLADDIDHRAVEGAPDDPGFRDVAAVLEGEPPLPALSAGPEQKLFVSRLAGRNGEIGAKLAIASLSWHL